MSEIYFVCKADRMMLHKILGEIPGLVDELSITVTRQDRTGKGGMKISSGSDEQPMPFNVGASDAGDYLRNELNTWARLVCEERFISYDGSDSVVGVSVWLRKNLASLAMTQGAEDALPGIESAMKRCRRAMDIPADDDVLLGLCPNCSSRVNAEADADSGSCRECSQELTREEGRRAIDREIDSLLLPAREAADLISIRYGAQIKPKTVHDMGYRKKFPIEPVALADGTAAFSVKAVIDDLMRRGRIA